MTTTACPQGILRFPNTPPYVLIVRNSVLSFSAITMCQIGERLFDADSLYPYFSSL